MTIRNPRSRSHWWLILLSSRSRGWHARTTWYPVRTTRRTARAGPAVRRARSTSAETPGTRGTNHENGSESSRFSWIGRLIGSPWARPQGAVARSCSRLRPVRISNTAPAPTDRWRPSGRPRKSPAASRTYNASACRCRPSPTTGPPPSSSPRPRARPPQVACRLPFVEDAAVRVWPTRSRAYPPTWDTNRRDSQHQPPTISCGGRGRRYHWLTTYPEERR